MSRLIDDGLPFIGSVLWVIILYTLVVAGGIKHEDVQRLAKRYFGWMPRDADPPHVAQMAPGPFKSRTITIKEDSAPAPAVGLGPDAGLRTRLWAGSLVEYLVRRTSHARTHRSAAISARRPFLIDLRRRCAPVPVARRRRN